MAFCDNLKESIYHLHCHGSFFFFKGQLEEKVIRPAWAIWWVSHLLQLTWKNKKITSDTWYWHYCLVPEAFEKKKYFQKKSRFFFLHFCPKINPKKKLPTLLFYLYRPLYWPSLHVSGQTGLGLPGRARRLDFLSSSPKLFYLCVVFSHQKRKGRPLSATALSIWDLGLDLVPRWGKKT